MEKLNFRYFLALFLLYGLIAIVWGQGKPKLTCGHACWGQQCIVSKNNCTSPCKCEKFFSPPDQGICVSCLTESCSCSTVPIADAPMRTCCAELRCLDIKTLQPAVFGEGICRK